MKTKTEASHTPAYESKINKKGGRIKHQVAFETFDTDDITAEEHACYLLRAINAHYRLLTFARAYADYCKKVGGDWRGVEEEIAKAEGK